MDAFIRDVCQCDHFNLNLMVSIKIETVGVCLVTGGLPTTIVAYAYLIKGLLS